MAESKSTVESVREWVSQHKLRTVGCLWLSGIAGSIAYNWSQPNMKTSVRLIHASAQGSPFMRGLEKVDVGKPYSQFYWRGCSQVLNPELTAFWARHLPPHQDRNESVDVVMGILQLISRIRLHAQALTLAALAGAAVVEYYESRSGAKADRYAKYFPPMDAHAHKD